jgi:transposase
MVTADAGGEPAAAIYSRIETARLNGLDPQAYLADVIARIGPHPARQLADLLPYIWRPAS